MGDNALADLSTRQRDRAAGALLGTAGDGLGGPNPGEWSGAAAQAIAVAELAATGADLRRVDIAERIVARWNGFAHTVGGPGGPTPVPSAPVAGRIVFVHGLRGRGRTAAVAALYRARRSGTGSDDALHDVQAVSPDAHPGSDFRAALYRLGDAA